MDLNNRPPLTLLAVTASLVVWAPVTWAGGYLSGYSGGSSQYLNGYSSGGYSAGSSAGYISYGGDSGFTSRSGSSRGGAGDIPRKYWSAWHRSEKLGDSGIWGNLFGVSPAAGTARPCGTYNRTPARCFRTTTKYDPAIHGLGNIRN